MINSNSRFFSIGLLALVVVSASCVSTTLQIPSDHPARTDVPGGRVEADPGAVLRRDAPLYQDQDGGSGRVSVSPLDDPVPNGTREAPYVGQGVIQGIGVGQLEIRHEAIPGFMGAMTMAFPVAEEAMDEPLEVGDEIIFKIEQHPEHGYRIFSIEAAP